MMWFVTAAAIGFVFGGFYGAGLGLALLFLAWIVGSLIYEGCKS